MGAFDDGNISIGPPPAPVGPPPILQEPSSVLPRAFRPSADAGGEKLYDVTPYLPEPRPVSRPISGISRPESEVLRPLPEATQEPPEFRWFRTPNREYPIGSPLYSPPPPVTQTRVIQDREPQVLPTDTAGNINFRRPYIEDFPLDPSHGEMSGETYLELSNRFDRLRAAGVQHVTNNFITNNGSMEKPSSIVQAPQREPFKPFVPSSPPPPRDVTKSVYEEWTYTAGRPTTEGIPYYRTRTDPGSQFKQAGGIPSDSLATAKPPPDINLAVSKLPPPDSKEVGKSVVAQPFIAPALPLQSIVVGYSRAPNGVIHAESSRVVRSSFNGTTQTRRKTRRRRRRSTR